MGVGRGGQFCGGYRSPEGNGIAHAYCSPELRNDHTITQMVLEVAPSALHKNLLKKMIRLKPRTVSMTRDRTNKNDPTSQLNHHKYTWPIG